MAMVVKNNMTAINTLNTLNKNQSALGKSLARVSSGVKINSAQDDASGYAISERMRVMVRSLDQANQNAQNGASMMKVAEGAVGKTVEILRTLKEKALSAATDTKTDDDRATIQKEIDQFVKQIDDNALITFNGKYLLDGSKTQRADFDTKSALTNQSLSKSTKGTTALVDLMSRKDESLLINSTDIVKASFVVNGKTYVTDYQVSDTTLQDVFSALNAEAEKDGVVGFGKANTDLKTVSSAVGSADDFQKLSQSALMKYSKDLKAMTNSDQVIANAAAFLAEHSLSDLENELKDGLSHILRTNLYLLYDGNQNTTPGYESGTAFGDLTVTIPDGAGFSTTVAQKVALESGNGVTSAYNTLGGQVGLDDLTLNIIDVARSYIETNMVNSKFSENLNDVVFDVFSSVSVGNGVYLRASTTVLANTSQNIGAAVWGKTSEIDGNKFFEKYEAGGGSGDSDTILGDLTDTAKLYAYAYLAQSIVDGGYDPTLISAGVSGRSASAFETAFKLGGEQNADRMIKLLGNTDTLEATEDLVRSAKIYAGTDDRSDALTQLASTVATTIISNAALKSKIDETMGSAQFYLTTADGDAYSGLIGFSVFSGTSTNGAAIDAGKKISEIDDTNGVGWAKGSDGALAGLANAIDGALDGAFDDALAYLKKNHSDLTVSNIYEAMTNSEATKEGTIYKFLTGFKFVSENGDEVGLEFDDDAKGAIARLKDDLDFQQAVRTVIAKRIGDLRASTDNGLVYRSSEIGRGPAQNLISTADGELGLTITAGSGGMNYQIAGLSVRITDSAGQSRTAVNEFLDAFHTTIFAGNKSDDNSLVLHTGPQAGGSISVNLDDMRAQALGLKGMDNSIVSVANVDAANAAISVFETALQKALDIQTTIGAIEARLEFTSDNLSTSSENVQAAESTIRDADMAKEMTEYTKNNVLLQAAQSMLAQANQNSSAVLSLLQ